ncbi:acyltransferase [Vibrio sp. CyArs1]|uniref:acyltransferase n=1 Tax=Vibrio sp. CyArs1 TaxID=2682577 RepID=UPI0023EEDAF2|nr:acyltransferase [Vibrio sp. CyArs1]
MIKFFAKKIKGDNFIIDNKIPMSYLLSLVISYALDLIRGFVRINSRVFISKGVKLKCKNNISLGRFCKVKEYCYLDGLSKNGINIGLNGSIGPYTRIECTGSIRDIGIGITIGDNFGVGAYSFFGAAGGISIGNNVIIGQYVSFHSENHSFDDMSKVIREQPVTRKGIILGNDIWVGSKVTFLDGTELNNRTIVAAGSVVNKKFPPNVIIAGVPAKIIGSC